MKEKRRPIQSPLVVMESADKIQKFLQASPELGPLKNFGIIFLRIQQCIALAQHESVSMSVGSVSPFETK